MTRPASGPSPQPERGVGGSPNAGDPAPDFSLPAQDRERYSLSQFRGKTVVLAFYLLDFTGG